MSPDKSGKDEARTLRLTWADKMSANSRHEAGASRLQEIRIRMGNGELRIKNKD